MQQACCIILTPAVVIIILLLSIITKSNPVQMRWGHRRLCKCTEVDMNQNLCRFRLPSPWPMTLHVGRRGLDPNLLLQTEEEENSLSFVSYMIFYPCSIIMLLLNCIADHKPVLEFPKRGKVSIIVLNRINKLNYLNLIN